MRTAVLPRPAPPPPARPTPTDPTATAAACKAVADAGVTIVFMGNVAAGLTAGKDYVAVVSADNYGNGVAAATAMGWLRRI